MRQDILYFELRRLFASKVFLLLVLFLSAFNGIKIYGTYLENEQLHKLSEANDLVISAYKKLNAQFEGELTNKKISFFMNQYYRPVVDQIADLTASVNSDSGVDLTTNPYIDNILISQFFYAPMQYDYLYAFKSADTAERAEYQTALTGNSFQKTKYTRIMERFRGRTIREFHHVDNFEWYFTHCFSTFLLLFFLLYGLSRLMISHDHMEMEALVLTTPRGGLPRIRAKLVAMTIFMTVLTIYFSCLDVVTFSFVFPEIKHWQMPLFSLSSCSNTPLNISLWQAGLLSLFYKLLGILLLSYFFILFAECVRSVFLPLIGISLLMAGMTVATELSIGTHQWFLRLINPMSYLICNINFFASSEVFPLFNKPLFIYEAALFFGLFLLFLLTALIFLFSRQSLWRKSITSEYLRNSSQRRKKVIVQ